jgi:hypothetical protein
MQDVWNCAASGKSRTAISPDLEAALEVAAVTMVGSFPRVLNRPWKLFRTRNLKAQEHALDFATDV